MGNEYENLKKQRYLQFVQQCARSGKSKREWCRENGIKYSTFMRWQRQLREELAGELRPMATAQDGLIEAVQLPGKKFVWAVQWHPEFSWKTDENSRKLFRAFVEACAKE